MVARRLLNQIDERRLVVQGQGLMSLRMRRIAVEIGTKQQVLKCVHVDGVPGWAVRIGSSRGERKVLSNSGIVRGTSHDAGRRWNRPYGERSSRGCWIDQAIVVLCRDLDDMAEHRRRGIHRKDE